VVADLGLGRVDYYRDVPELLYKAGYLDADLRDTWMKMIGFRKVLVHDYMEIDHSQVYIVLQEHLKDFYRLRKVFAQFL